MEDIKNTEEFQKALNAAPMIGKGEVVLEHLSESKLKAFLRYQDQLLKSLNEQVKINQEMFAMLREGIPGKYTNIGIRSNGETLVLIKSSNPENPTNILGSILSGCFQRK